LFSRGCEQSWFRSEQKLEGWEGRMVREEGEVEGLVSARIVD